MGLGGRTPAEVQVDFGKGAPVKRPGRNPPAGGKRRRPHVLRVVLSCSRKAYSEAIWRQTTDAFLVLWSSDLSTGIPSRRCPGTRT